ncbi:MAG: S8/S53 family peptidase [Actinomycetota bacterium]
MIRRVLVAATVVSALFAAAPGSANTTQSGTILVPVATVSRVHRCATTTDGQKAQGVTGWTLTPTSGKGFILQAEKAPNNFDITFYASLASCEQSAVGLPYANGAADEAGIVPQGANVALITLATGVPGAAFTYTESDVPVPPSSPLGPRPFTVVGVIDGGFSPYHYDFLGHQHPFNLDNDTSNDVDFGAVPSGYIEGFPATTPINITIPTSPTQDVSTLKTGADAAEWAKLQTSTATNVKMYRFPGTKVIGAVNFSGSFYGNNDSHGTRSAASAAGNIHGSCPECLFVLINGSTNDALAWAAQQPWIDVLTNSYGHSVVGGPIRDNIYLQAPLDATKAASEDGMTIVFSAGNGLANAFDVPMFTYWSSQKGPDWMITVGAVDPAGDQQYSGAGKPVDISSYGVAYPSSGGTTANGVGTHSGTSNAAPVTAGTFARVIQKGREALGDFTEGHAGGVVASGQAVSCGAANPACPLGDGTLTRAEVQDTIFHNVLPSGAAVVADTVWPSTQYNYYYQGFGVIAGRLRETRYVAEQSRFEAALKGQVSSFARPAGETNWFIVDSKCRQKLWGSWNGGYYSGSDPALDIQTDPIATAFNTWCSKTPDAALKGLAKLIYG